MKDALTTLPTDLLKLVIAACAITDLASVAATSIIMKETSRDRRTKLAVLKANPFNVVNIGTILELELICKHISDQSLIAFSDALHNGALANLTTLRLGFNRIGDPGLASLADACAKGALAQLRILDLEYNKIGDAGVSSLACACAKGALAQLRVLDLLGAQISDHIFVSIAVQSFVGRLLCFSHG